MAINAGTVEAHLVLNMSQFQTGLQTAGAMLTEFGRGGGIIGQQIHGIGAEMTQTGQALSETGNTISGTSEELSEAGETLSETSRQAESAGENLSEAGDQAKETGDKVSETGDKVKKSGDKVAELGKKFTETGSKIQGVGKDLTTIGGTLTRNVTLPLVGAGAAALTVAANFDEGMSKVQAISGATGEDLEKLRDKAREMGSKTKFSATEAADAMSYMAMAGWKTGEMLDGIEGIMNLAAASGEDLATTSDIVTDALTAFGLKAKDSAHFSDILAAASSNANTNVSMLGESFKYCAPIAGAMGYSAEDVAEALGLMANSGIKASQAGTAMRSIMTKLTGDFKISGKELGDVTIKTQNADGSMRELSDILADCRGAFSKLTESEKSANAETLAGKYAMSGFLALMNAAPEDVDKLSGAIADCDGAAEKMAATMQNNLKGQLTILKSQAEELAIGFGTELMPVAQDLVGVASSAVQAFSGLDDGAKKFIVYAGLAAAAMGPLTSVIGSVTSGVGSMITTLSGAATAFSAAGGGAAGLGAAITSIIGPAGWVVLGLGAVTAAGVALYAATRDANKGTRELGEAFKGAADNAKTFYEEVQNGGSVNLTSSFSSELNSGINMNDLQQKITDTQQKINDVYDKAIKKRDKLTKKDIKELKKYYDDLKKLHEEQSKYYASNLTTLVQAVNDGLELNEESAQEILKQGKANMDAALKAEEQAHNDRITAIEKIYKDDEAARKKAIAQENADYAKHKEEIKSAFADLTSEVTNGYAEQNLAGSEFFEKLKQYNADVEAENKRHNEVINEIANLENQNYATRLGRTLAENQSHEKKMDELNKKLANSFDNSTQKQIGAWIAMTAQTIASSGEISAETEEFARNFLACFDGMPEDVQKNMDEVVANMKITDSTGEIIDSVDKFCSDITQRFKAQQKETEKAGEDLGNSYGKGLFTQKNNVGEKADSVATNAIIEFQSQNKKDQAKKGGEETADAYNSGIESKETDAKKSGEDVASAAVKPMGAPTPKADAKRGGQGLVTSMTDGMDEKKPTAITTAGGIMTDMHTAMGAVSFTGIGGGIVGGILKGINDKKPSLITAAAGFAASAVAAAKRALGINSPSRVMMEVGRFTAEGMEQGLKQGSRSLYETASAISDETAEALSGISSHRVSLSGAHSTNYGDRLDRLLDAVERLADSQTTMEIDGRPFGRLVKEALR